MDFQCMQGLCCVGIVPVLKMQLITVTITAIISASSDERSDISEKKTLKSMVCTLETDTFKDI
jgi:hypothetical protein